MSTRSGTSCIECATIALLPSPPVGRHSCPRPVSGGGSPMPARWGGATAWPAGPSDSSKSILHVEPRAAASPRRVWNPRAGLPRTGHTPDVDLPAPMLLTSLADGRPLPSGTAGGSSRSGTASARSPRPVDGRRSVAVPAAISPTGSPKSPARSRRCPTAGSSTASWWSATPMGTPTSTHEAG